MTKVCIDRYDACLLEALQVDASSSNALLGERIGLSPSQVSRRRARLESAGIIRAYRAELSPAALGLELDVIIRLCLHSHSGESVAEFRHFLQSLPAVRLACAITGDADYLLHVRLPNLAALSTLINAELSSHPDVREVRSEVVLELIEDRAPMPVPKPVD